MLQLFTDRSAISTEKAVAVDVLVRIVPDIPAEQAERPPLNLALVLDRSGSMAGEKIRLTRQAASRAVESLLEGDVISIVLFDQSVNVLVSQAQAREKARALALLSRVEVGGQTALFAAWERGSHEVLTTLDKQRMNRVVLLTDGEANVGETRIDPICSAVSRFAGQGVQTTTLGFGGGYNEDLLRAMAASGDGNHFYVESAEQLAPFLEMELCGLRATQGKQVRLRLQPAPGVRVEWLGRVELDGDGAVKLSDLISHCPLQRVLRLHAPAGHLGPLLKVGLAWTCAREGAPRECVSILQLPCVDEAERLALAPDPVVVAQVSVAEMARLRELAMEELKRGQERSALELLRSGLRLPLLPAEESEDAEDLIRTLERGDYGSGHKKAAMSGHAYSSGHGSAHYKKGEAHGSLPLREGRLLRTAPSGGGRAWNRVEGMLRGLLYGGGSGEVPSLVLATLQCLRRQPFEVNSLVQALAQAPVLGPSPGLARMRAMHAAGRPWNQLGGDTAGCGALRRIAPLLVPHCNAPRPSLWREVAVATALTHQNNAALVASLGTAKLLWEMLGVGGVPASDWYLQHFLEWSLDLEDGRSYPSHGRHFRGWRGTLCQFLSAAILEARTKNLTVPQVMLGWGSGPYVFEMVPNWLYILERHAHEPALALEMAVSNTVESHSLGALVGAALGALHGPQPGWALAPELEQELALVRDRWF
ncbi:MAG: VWA domain-containing protein [Candidatus Eremiobacteraeota bacterium]|nr:VWA domain-containing protein [Candidatus Eremiobacteraeota bacterium]MCW5868422.1 VWA domain-containing protein [Candidatus Eremiobacteraeota bacterium]